MNKIREILKKTGGRLRSIFLEPSTPQRWTRCTVITLLALIIIMILTIVLVDPCYRYRYPSIAGGIYDEERMQLPGILRNSDCDMVLFGSSMSQNFQLSDLKEAFGVRKPIKATGGGMRSGEIALLMDILLQKEQKVSTIAYMLDFFALTDECKISENQYRLFLQEPFETNELQYWFSFMTWNNFIYQPVRWSLVRRGRYDEKSNENMMFGWDQKKLKYFGPEAIKAALANPAQRPPAPTPTDEALGYLKDHILNRLEKFHRQGVRLVVIFPPYSLIYWSILDKQGNLDCVLATKEQIIRQLQTSFPALEIYDYNVREEIITELKLYKDSTHYCPDVNRQICQWLKSGDGRISDMQEVRENAKKLRKLLKKHRPEYEAEGYKL